MPQTNEIGNNEKRFGSYPGLDVLKMLLALLVIIRHCGQIYYGENRDLYYTCIVSGLSTAAVPTFFCISGFLFYMRENNLRVNRQIVRLVKLYIVWSIIYFPVRIWRWGNDGRLFEHLIVYMKEALFSGTYYHLWYLPALAFALWVTSFLRNRVNRRTVYIAIVLLVIGLLGDSYRAFAMTFAGRYITLYEAVFITTRNGLFVGVPFVLLGRFFAESQEKCLEFASKYREIMLGGLLVSIVLLMVESYYLHDRYHNSINNILICSIPFAACSFLLFVGIGNVCKEYMLVFIRKMSTLVFCCHPLVIGVIYVISDMIGIQADIMSYTLGSIIITCIISWVIIWLSAKIEVLKILY